MMASNNLPPINSNQAIVDPKTGRGKSAFVLLINELINKVVSSSAAALTAFLATAPTTTTLDITGAYGTGVTIDLDPLTPDPTGTYGDATHSAQVTIDEYGRVTDVADIPITGGGGGGGDYVLLDTQPTVAGTREVSFIGIDQTYRDLIVTVEDNSTFANSDDILAVFNNTLTAVYNSNLCSRFEYDQYIATTSMEIGRWNTTGFGVDTHNYIEWTIYNYTLAGGQQKGQSRSFGFGGGNYFPRTSDTWYTDADGLAITRIDIYTKAGNFVGAGQACLYGRK